jgi:membrane protease YdiL (CAAX protease family)
MQPLPLPPQGGGFDSFLTTVKPLIPIPVLLALVPALWWFFRSTWHELDEEATRFRAVQARTGRIDMRPLVALVMCAAILTMQEYYGGAVYYAEAIRPLVSKLATHYPKTFRFEKYEELYNYVWWSFTRVFGYSVVPFAVWKAVFPEDSLLDMGLRARGFFKHTWIYGMCLAIVVPLLLLVSRQPDFGTYYPFYRGSSRSWFDFLAWEALYFAQFFALEMFFRGFWLGALRRSFGSGAIFAMAVPYCMIHFGKPFLEANGAIIAGIFLGSVSMKTKSIYQGFLVHITVAGLMDWLALSHRHALPTVFFAP